MVSRLGVAMAVLGAVLLVTSSLGVSTVALERGIEIEVVDDDDAMVGFETVGNDSTDEYLVVRNRGGEPFKLERATVTAPGSVAGERMERVVIGDDETIAAGESAELSPGSVCENATEVTIHVELSSTGVLIDRTKTLECNG